jgi:hypothetical protein
MVAIWHQAERSAALHCPGLDRRDIDGRFALVACAAYNATETLAAKFAVMHNAALPTTV